MPRFAANLSLMFTEWPFIDRFAAAADAGFSAVECQFPYACRAAAVAEQLARHRLTFVLLNAPPGDYERGDRGLAALPARRAEFEMSVAAALSYAEMVGARRIHLMAGIAPWSDAIAQDAFESAVIFACDKALEHGIDILIEPLNPYDMPGYFLGDYRVAAGLIRRLGLPNLKLQFDIYHRQILHGDVSRALEDLMPIIGHVQTASVPGRNEPGAGELNDAMIFRRLDALGYGGFVGAEYRPRGATLESLGWFTPQRG